MITGPAYWSTAATSPPGSEGSTSSSGIRADGGLYGRPRAPPHWQGKVNQPSASGTPVTCHPRALDRTWSCTPPVTFPAAISKAANTVVVPCRAHYFGPSPPHRRITCRVRGPWPGHPRVNIQNGNGQAKSYQVRQVKAAIDKKEPM